MDFVDILVIICMQKGEFVELFPARFGQFWLFFFSIFLVDFLDNFVIVNLDYLVCMVQFSLFGLFMSFLVSLGPFLSNFALILVSFCIKHNSV